LHNYFYFFFVIEFCGTVVSEYLFIISQFDILFHLWNKIMILFPKYFYWFNSKIFFILISYSWFWEWYYFVKSLNIWCWLMWESYTIFKLYSHISSVKYYFRESLFKIVTVILLNILSRTLQLGRYFRFNFC
jgi:hypothetical protein